jgi:hypothetical protein
MMVHVGARRAAIVLGGMLAGFAIPYLVMLAGAVTFFPAWREVPFEDVLPMMTLTALVVFFVASIITARDDDYEVTLEGEKAMGETLLNELGDIVHKARDLDT